MNPNDNNTSPELPAAVSGNQPGQQFAKESILRTPKKIRGLYLVLIASLLVVVYYALVASPRYATESRFVVKESGTRTELTGLAALGAVSSSSRDSLVIKAFIESRAMASELQQRIGLKDHYQSSKVDWISRLPGDATAEEYLEYYQSRVTVVHDEMSDIVMVELQAFDADYALQASQVLLDISEEFINELGDKMAREQMAFAQQEVERAHGILKQQQTKLLSFQEQNRLFNPEQEGGAILEGVSALQIELIKAQARLKELSAVMREDSAEVRGQKNLIESLESQLREERARLTQDEEGGFNKINMDFKEITLASELATDLYTSSLGTLEQARSQAMQKLKHLLIVEPPQMPEEAKYPRRVYSVVTWFAGLLLIYFIGRLLHAVVKEHKD